MRPGLIGRIIGGDGTSSYRPELDGLRVIAILPVLISHIAERILRVAAAQNPDPAAQAL